MPRELQRHVALADQAAGDQAAVAVDVALVSGGEAPVSQGLEFLRGLSAAGPGPALGVRAALIVLGGVDAVQPDSLTLDLEGVAIDHPGHAGDRWG